MSATIKNAIFTFYALFLLTSALGFPIEITSPVIGGCIGTEFKCCQDGVTACRNSTCGNCPDPYNLKNLTLGGCVSTEFHCCPDGITACDDNCTNCPNITRVTGTTQVNMTIANLTSKLIGGCASTQFGCCMDNITACSGGNEQPPCSNCLISVIM